MNIDNRPSLNFERESLINSLRREGILKTRVVEKALRSVNREDFLWRGEEKPLAYVDEPLSLGETRQTISAPHMIVIMLEEMELSPGMRVLEVGTGSGYNTALMSSIVSPEMRSGESLVISVERDERLVAFAKRNLERAGFGNKVKVMHGDGSLGYPERSERQLYDRIIVTAGSPRVPNFLKKQLKLYGLLLVPVGGREYQTLASVRRRSETNEERSFELKNLEECIFVPLIGKDAFLC